VGVSSGTDLILQPPYFWALALQGLVLDAVLMWQVILGVRAARDLATATVSRKGIRGLEGTAITLKAAWVAAGATGTLPGFLGGGLEVWDLVRSDGVLSYLLAGLLVLSGLGLALSRDRDATREVDLRLVMCVVLAICLPLVATLMAQASQRIYVGIAWEDTQDLLFGRGLAGGVVLAALTAGVISGICRGWRKPETLFLLLFGVVHFLQAAYVLAEYDGSAPTDVAASPHLGSGRFDGPGAFELATVDVLVSLVCFGALFSRRVRNNRRSTRLILTISILWSLGTYTVFLVPPAASQGLMFFVLIVVTLGYQLGADAKRINRSGSGRLGVLALLTLLTAVILVGTDAGYIYPDATFPGLETGMSILRPVYLVSVSLAIVGTYLYDRPSPRRRRVGRGRNRGRRGGAARAQ